MKKEKTTASKLAMFDALMENIPDSIYFKDLKSRFIGISKAVAKRLNIDNPDEVLGKTDYDYFSKEHAGKALSDEQNIIKANIPLIKIEEKETYESGEDKWVSTIKMPLYDEKREIVGTFGISRDITERKKAVQALEESNIKAQMYLDIAAEIIFSLDKAGNITLLNGSGHKLLGYNNNELIGKNWFETCLPDEVKVDVYGVFKKIMNGDVESVKNYENAVKTKGGELRTILWHNTALMDSSGNITGLMSSGEDITERKKTEVEILYLSYHDQLTGLYNRRFFEEELKRLDTIRQLPESIIIADVDGLKYVNDSYGHEKGDRLLIAASEIIKKSCRKEDIVARYGGDEFIIFLPKTSEGDAREIMDRIRKSYKIQKLDDEIAISISLGVSTKYEMGVKIEDTIKQADKNMYIDKASKNNKDIG